MRGRVYKDKDGTWKVEGVLGKKFDVVNTSDLLISRDYNLKWVDFEFHEDSKSKVVITSLL